MHHRRAFLAGDAAHIHSPTGGQGGTTGVQEVNPAWKLARVCRGAPPALLKTYDEERLPQAAEVLRETDRTTGVMFAPNPVVRAVCDAVVLPLLRRPWVQQRMFGKLSQLHTHHRQSCLSWHRVRGSGRGIIRAGDRAPDVAFRRARTGQLTTLFELRGAFRPVVLFNEAPDCPDLQARLRALDVDAYAVGSPRGPIDERVELLDVHHDLKRLYGLAHGFLCLIRPDGHVGLLLVPPRLEELREYLELIGESRMVRSVFP